MTCQHPETNHSSDLLAVYHGRTVPTILCGYHESRGLESALDAIADASAAITCENCNTQLDANNVESYYVPTLCDDCNQNRAVALAFERLTARAAVTN